MHRQGFLRLPSAILCACLTGLLTACATSPPSQIEDACVIFRERSDWYESATESYQNWGIPLHVQLAIIYQESRFNQDAVPPRVRLLGFIPWGRESSAYGYAQVIDPTWDWYMKKTGNSGADRDEFEDAVDFIGWYGDLSHRTLGIAKSDAYNQYLAYHEGHAGFKRKTYRGKPWLIKVSRKVASMSNKYQRQLARCKDDLDSGWGWW